MGPMLPMLVPEVVGIQTSEKQGRYDGTRGASAAAQGMRSNQDHSARIHLSIRPPFVQY